MSAIRGEVVRQHVRDGSEQYGARQPNSPYAME